MHADLRPYFQFTSRARLEKSVNSLLGLIEGIAIDGRINDVEVSFMRDWLAEHEELKSLHPFNELVPVVAEAVSDGVLTQDEREDIVWLCERLRSTEYFDRITADLQRLHAILGGVIADMQITEEELRGLSAWLAEHEHLRTCWPYDEIGSLVTSVLKDRRIDEEEHRTLHRFFSEFIAFFDGRTITSAPILEGGSVVGLCAVCPDIKFQGQTFCFTGLSMRYPRKDLADVVVKLGGEFLGGVSKKVNYLVIGASGNPCWAYSCYGRKVEKAVELRKAGARIVLVHENDFHDAVLDLKA
ncbi:BRCT domain-containing protein [Lysobacter terrae]